MNFTKTASKTGELRFTKGEIHYTMFSKYNVKITLYFETYIEQELIVVRNTSVLERSLIGC